MIEFTYSLDIEDVKEFLGDLEKAEDLEYWWSLDELKKLWPGKLISGGPMEED